MQAGLSIPGNVDAFTGSVSPGDMSEPGTGDMLDGIREMVLRNGGEVVVVPAERMPSPGWRRRSGCDRTSREQGGRYP